MEFFKEQRVDMVTEVIIFGTEENIPYFNDHTDLLRPANYPTSCPGKGIGFFTCKGFTIAVN